MPPAVCRPAGSCSPLCNSAGVVFQSHCFTICLNVFTLLFFSGFLSFKVTMIYQILLEFRLSHQAGGLHYFLWRIMTKKILIKANEDSTVPCFHVTLKGHRCTLLIPERLYVCVGRTHLHCKDGDIVPADLLSVQ